MKRFKARQACSLFIFILGVFFITGCGGGGETGHWLPGESDTTAPMVTAVVPLPNATGVPINTKIITATFTKAMDATTLTTGSFTLACPAGTAVTGTVSYLAASYVATLTLPAATNLPPSTVCVATVTTGAKDTAGNALASNFTWIFTTGATPDTTPPMVTATINANGATGVATNTKVGATFSEAMDPSTITASTFTLKQGTTAVPGTVAYSGVTAVFTPASNLAFSTTYTATITTGARDLAGNALASDYVWSWTTGAAPDTTLPVVTLTVPANGAAGVLINTRIAATFTEAMDPLTINTITFTLKQGATAVAGTVTYSGVTAVFIPLGPLAFNTTYTATITTGARDLAGNALASNFVWSFITGAAPDTTPPTVSSTIPVNTATGVAVNSAMAAAFSEAMDPLTITTATFTLTQGGIPVSGVVTYAGVTATFKPAGNLLFSTMYTATITTGAKDLAGNALASNFTWIFTTGAAPDTTAPTVSSTVPVNVATGVAINIKVGATFSEALDPLTITNLNFTLKETVSGAAVAGVVSYSGVSAVFTPLSNLANSRRYTATVKGGAGGVKDLAGNALASDYAWSWTTGAAPDTTRPTVTLAVPASTAPGFLVPRYIVATFSEAMDPFTISTATFTLTQAGTPIPGTVSYAGVTAIFTTYLGAGTTYTVTVTAGSRDLAGNQLAGNQAPLPAASDYVWSFTTAALPPPPDIVPPVVTLTVPANGATDVCINKAVAATFSKEMDPLTITNLTFTVAGVIGTVTYDASTKIATFTPTGDLAASTPYTATITTGVKDLAGNGLAVNKVWSFTTGTTSCAIPVVLGAAAPFGGFGGGVGMTNQGILTIVNGDIGTTGVSTTLTGFHDTTGDGYTETPLNIGAVNGRIYTAPPPPVIFGPGGPFGGTAVTFVIATAAASDALIAYNSMSPAALPGGVDPGAGQLGGLTLFPGIYQAAGGTFLLTGSDLTLDGQGDPNAVWVFQTAAGLTVGAPGFPRSIIMTNGAQAKNVFWYVGSSARIENRCNMVGTIIASAGVTISTAGELQTTTLNGRALGLNASVTMVNTLINVPAP